MLGSYSLTLDFLFFFNSSATFLKRKPTSFNIVRVSLHKLLNCLTWSFFLSGYVEGELSSTIASILEFFVLFNPFFYNVRISIFYSLLQFCIQSKSICYRSCLRWHLTWERGVVSHHGKAIFLPLD